MNAAARRTLFVPAVTLAAICCCGKIQDLLREPDVTPVRNVLKSAMPLGYAANLTMAAMQGASLPNVTMVRNGSDTSTGCFLLNIIVDSTFPLPGNTRATGIITTAGIIVDNRTAIMTAVFSQMNVSQGSFVLRDISTFPAIIDSDLISGKKELFVVYADIDVNAGSDTLVQAGISQGQITAELTKYQTMKSFDSGVTLAENGWIIRVDDNGTLSDASDDRYTVSGGGQYVEVSNAKNEIVQLAMINAAMSPLCKYNPTAGYALWQNVGAGPLPSDVDIGHVFLTFHNTCDGNAHVTVATGVYIKSFGEDIALGLDR